MLSASRTQVVSCHHKLEMSKEMFFVYIVRDNLIVCYEL